jgi:hypothetical protein
MKLSYFLSLVIVAFILTVGKAYSQDTASVTWKLTKPDTTEVSATVGNITGQKEAFSGLIVYLYNGPVGPTGDSAQKTNIIGNSWPGGEAAAPTTRYIEFKVTPKPGYVFNVTNITLPMAGKGSSNMSADVYYSTDGFNTSVVKLNSSLVALPKDAFLVPDPSYSPADLFVPGGTTLSVRVFPFNKTSAAASGKYICLQKAVILGTTSAVTGIKDPGAKVSAFELSQNYPNPFNPSTVINFAIPTSSHVKLRVYNALGNEVATLVNQDMAEGLHAVSFNASALTSGVYFYKLEAGKFTSIKKMMLVK